MGGHVGSLTTVLNKLLLLTVFTSIQVNSPISRDAGLLIFKTSSLSFNKSNSAINVSESLLSMWIPVFPSDCVI